MAAGRCFAQPLQTAPCASPGSGRTIASASLALALRLGRLRCKQAHSRRARTEAHAPGPNLKNRRIAPASRAGHPQTATVARSRCRSPTRPAAASSHARRRGAPRAPAMASAAGTPAGERRGRSEIAPPSRPAGRVHDPARIPAGEPCQPHPGGQSGADRRTVI